MWHLLYFSSTTVSPILQVSSLFKDGTIGTDINIVVVSLLLLEQDPVSGFRLQFSKNTSFCTVHWLIKTLLTNLYFSPFHFQLGLTINHHADQSLNSFCQWQSGLVGKGGKRHDHAILLTGLDICSWKNEPCDTLGKTVHRLQAQKPNCLRFSQMETAVDSMLYNEMWELSLVMTT